MNQKKRKTTTIGIPVHELGKLPPQAVALEEAVLGAMLLEKEALGGIIDLLSDVNFYKEQNQLVYAAMVSLYKRREPVDILTVTQELKVQGKLELVGGSYYVSALTNRIASSANIEFHGRIVLQKFLARELIRISTDTIKRAYEDSEDVFEVYADSMAKVEASLSGVIKNDAKRIDQLHAELMHKNRGFAETGGQSGVPSLYTDLDKLTNGWQKADLIILAGRPGMGKTAVAINLAIRPALIRKKPVAIFSLEMPSIQLVGRIQGILSGVNSSRIIKGQTGMEELVQIENRVSKVNIYDAPIYIDDTPSLNILELRAKARRLKAKYGIELIVIDYLQLMSGTGEGNREQEISGISRGLKALAKELDIPIIALSQLSRQTENRPGMLKRPQLSDLRESGAIEQDADMVIFTYRPTYYGITEYELEDKMLVGDSCKEILELIIAKHRSGGLGTVILGFKDQTTNVTDWDWGNMIGSDVTIEQLIDLENVKKDCKFVQSEKTEAEEGPKLQNNTDFLKEGTNPGF